MAEQYAGVRLDDSTVRYSQRAYTLQDVRADVAETASAASRPSIVGHIRSALHRKLHPLQDGSARSGSLTIDGPGFGWKIPLTAKQIGAAQRFAESVNRAARAYSVSGSAAPQVPQGSTPDLTASGGLVADDSVPTILQHAFTTQPGGRRRQ